MLEEFNTIAARIAELLRARGEKIAVADGATGGLISASLLTVPGAMSFYVGGGVVYSKASRDALYGLGEETFEGMKSATEDYAALQAKAIRDNFRADWGIAESGAAGSSKHPMGVASGRSSVGIAGPGGLMVTQVTETDSDVRMANMEAFTRRALEFLEATLREARL
ncbi:MAG: CinA family protein [Alphaproteobacteria bacterium]|nr:CinA family protein [Alphaproteobacteria bacterium]